MLVILGSQERGRQAQHSRAPNVPALVLAFMGGHLAGGGEGEAAACPYAVEVVGGLAVDTALILAFLILIELLEAILGIGIIFDVVALVLLNVTLVLEGEGAPRSPARASRRREWLAVRARSTTQLLSPASLWDKDWGQDETVALAAEGLRSFMWANL